MSDKLYDQLRQCQVVPYYTTTNYEMFKLDAGNRPIDDNHLLRLTEEIEANNLLKENPIQVKPDGKQLAILDGQHRYLASKSLEIPIYFIVTERVSIPDVARQNSNIKHWSLEEYLHSYCKQGNLEYLRLKKFWDAHKRDKFSLSSCMRLCYYGNDSSRGLVRGGNMANLFKTGKYKANDVPFGEKVVKACLDFAQFVPFYYEANFTAMVNNLLANQDYDHDRMMKKMSYQSTKLVKCPSAKYYMELVNDIYNYRVTATQYVPIRWLSPTASAYRSERKLVTREPAKQSFFDN